MFHLTFTLIQVMKKLFTGAIALLALIFVSNPALAQYEKGDLLINPGISLLGYGYGYGSYSGLPGLTASVEYSLTDMFAVGGYAGYMSRSYNFLGYKSRWTNLGFGARGILHASSFLNALLNTNINAEKLDIYGGLILGFETYSWKDDDTFGLGQSRANSSAVVFGGVLGTRYMFSPRFGVYGELGRGAFGALTLGVTLKL